MMRCRCACCTASQTARKSRRRSPNERALALAVLRERNAFHVLHGKPGGSVGEHVRVVQPSQWRDDSARQGALLQREAFASRGREGRVAQHLDCRDVTEVVADRRDRPRPSHPRRETPLCGTVRSGRWEAGCSAIEHAQRRVGQHRGRARSSRRRLPRNSARTSATSDGSSARAASRSRGLLVRRKVGDGVKERLNAFPASGIHRSSSAAMERAASVRAAQLHGQPCPRCPPVAQNRRLRYSSSCAVSATSSPPKKRPSTICA